MADWSWWPRFHDASLRLTPREQVAVHWDANLRMLRDWRACWTFTWISLLPVPLLALSVAPAELALSTQNRLAMGAGVVLLLGYLLLQHVAFSVAMRRTYLPFVRESLTALGHPTCVGCGHRLGPEPPAACPECGTAHRGSR